MIKSNIDFSLTVDIKNIQIKLNIYSRTDI